MSKADQKLAKRIAKIKTKVEKYRDKMDPKFDRLEGDKYLKLSGKVVKKLDRMDRRSIKTTGRGLNDIMGY